MLPLPRKNAVNHNPVSRFPCPGWNVFRVHPRRDPIETLRVSSPDSVTRGRLLVKLGRREERRNVAAESNRVTTMDVTKMIAELRTEQHKSNKLFLFCSEIAAGQGRRRNRPPRWMIEIKRQGWPHGSKNKSKNGLLKINVFSAISNTAALLETPLGQLKRLVPPLHGV